MDHDGDITNKTNKASQLIGNRVIEAVLLRPNSMLIMGGFFQGQMLHETIPHDIIVAMMDMVLEGKPLQFSNSDDQLYLTKLMNCEGWEKILLEATACFRTINHSFIALFYPVLPTNLVLRLKTLLRFTPCLIVFKTIRTRACTLEQGVLAKNLRIKPCF